METVGGSLTLIGLIATFIIFAYNIFNTYAENRKNILRTILINKASPNDVEEFTRILNNIQRIGKGCCNKTELEKLKSVFNPETFIKAIERLRERRKWMTIWGFILILLWGGKSCLIQALSLVDQQCIMLRCMRLCLFCTLILITLAYIGLTLFWWINDEID